MSKVFATVGGSLAGIYANEAVASSSPYLLLCAGLMVLITYHKWIKPWFAQNKVFAKI